MKTRLLEQAMSPQVMDQAWRRLKSEHTPWSPGIDRETLQRHLMRHLLACRQEVLDGSYRPLPLRQFPLQKPAGGTRVISAQYLRDKLVQRALLITLEPRAESLFHDDSYAYRPNRNVEQALTRVRERVRIGLHWLVDGDIRKFFDSIPHRPLLKLLSGFVADGAACKLIKRWVDQGAHSKSLLSKPRGISQGSILSPLFCNLYLHQLDTDLSRANIPFVRFADDFLLFASEREPAERALAFVTERLEDLGLAIHPEKTQIILSHPRGTFLGERLPKAGIGAA